MDKRKFQIPVWSLGYLIYGVEDGLDESEMELVDKFLSNKPYFVCDCDDNKEFCWNPIYGKPCDCVTAKCVWGLWFEEDMSKHIKTINS